MPHKVIREPSGMYVKFWGKCAIPELFKVMEEAGTDPHFENMRYLLLDYLDVVEQNVTEAQVEEIAALGFALRFTNPHFLHVSVANDETICSLVKYAKTAVFDPERVAYFSTLEQARSWIQQQHERARFVRTGFLC